MLALPERLLACALLGACILACPARAHADVSSWLFVGGGASRIKAYGDAQTTGDFTLDLGMGSPPSGSLIVGGVWRLQPHFGYGTDFGLSLRTATHGFVNGDWGLALDLGGYLRTMKTSEGALGSLVLGGPWGLVLAMTGTLGTHDANSVSGLLGIDFARLTIYRRSGDTWWKNPRPAYRP